MNLYETLGLKKDATHDEVKKAYRKKANENHPDKPGGDSDKMKAIVRAKDVLLNVDKRKHYDETGEEDGENSASAIDHMVNMIFSQVIENNLDEGDIITQAKNQVLKGIGGGNTFITTTQQVVRKLEKNLGRVIAKESENNVFEELLKLKIDTFQKALAKAKIDLAVLEGALEVMESYEDTRPVPVEMKPFSGFNNLYTGQPRRF